MVNGFNHLFHEKKKLGSWENFLEMRESIIQVNGTFRNLLSKDLGALSGLLFDIGVGKILIDENVQMVLEKEQKKRERLLQKRHKEVQDEIEEESEHTKIQYLLLKIGKSLGYDVLAASNDRKKAYNGVNFTFLSLETLPHLNVADDVKRTIELIDVIWIEKESQRIVCAFEVERSTSIYSGILRMTDLSLALPETEETMLYLVAPDRREKEIVAQLKRPSISANKDVNVSYILFSELCEHCDSICVLGDDYHIMEKVARCV